MSSRLFFLVLSDFLSRCVDVSRPDRLSSAEITSVVQAAGLQGVNGALHSSTVDLSNFTAVRKNRYVILPIDFEEAWKVSNVAESIRTHVLILKKKIPSFHHQQTVKRGDETHEFCKQATLLGVPPLTLLLFALTDR